MRGPRRNDHAVSAGSRSIFLQQPDACKVESTSECGDSHFTVNRVAEQGRNMNMLITYSSLSAANLAGNKVA
jgi:hypothetical protein